MCTGDTAAALDQLILKDYVSRLCLLLSELLKVFTKILNDRTVGMLGHGFQVSDQVSVTLVGFTAGTSLARGTLLHGSSKRPATLYIMKLEISLCILSIIHESPSTRHSTKSGISLI